MVCIGMAHIVNFRGSLPVLRRSTKNHYGPGGGSGVMHRAQDPAYIVMAHGVMAYIAMAYIAMPHVVMAYIVMAYIVMADITMNYAVIAVLATAYIGMA